MLHIYWKLAFIGEEVVTTWPIVQFNIRINIGCLIFSSIKFCYVLISHLGGRHIISSRPTSLSHSTTPQVTLGLAAF